MSLKKITQLKQDKGFRLWDILIYGIVLLAIGALFIGFMFVDKGDSLKDLYAQAVVSDTQKQVGFEIKYDNAVIFRYDFVKDEYSVTNEQKIEVLQNDNSLLKFHIKEGDHGFNTVVVDKVAITIDMLEANCSARRDCVKMAKIATTKQTIICTPHKLILTPFGYQAEDVKDLPSI